MGRTPTFKPINGIVSKMYRGEKINLVKVQNGILGYVLLRGHRANLGVGRTYMEAWLMSKSKIDRMIVEQNY